MTLSTTPPQAVFGDSVSITCSVTLLNGLTGVPSFQWEGPGVDPLVPSTNTLESTLDINSIQTSQAGSYMCTVNISFFNVNETIDITLQSELLYILK